MVLFPKTQSSGWVSGWTWARGRYEGAQKRKASLRWPMAGEAVSIERHKQQGRRREDALGSQIVGRMG